MVEDGKQKKLGFKLMPNFHLVYYEEAPDGKKRSHNICGLWLNDKGTGYSGKCETELITESIRVSAGTKLWLFKVEPKSENKKA